LKKAFTQLQKTTERDSDLSDSKSEAEDSHFQFGDGFQFTQMKVKQMAIKFEPRIAKLFKQTHGTKIKLDLKKVILLDSQSTMDLICDPALVELTFKSSHSMRLKSNGGTMEVKKQAIMPGYHMHMWYNKEAITNILSLSNVIKQYRVTYDSNDQMFVVHREPEGKPDMEFRMHESGQHYFDPRDSEFIFVNTVSENKSGFMKRQIKEAEVAQSLYSKLNYPSWKDFKWIIRRNQIKDCPVTVKHVDTALKIWGKNVAALKGKTTRTQPDPVARDFAKIPVELLKLHKEVYITANLFFVNKIPFFLTLSCKICFTAINHLADRTVPQIFMAFKEIYQYYLQRGFRITTVHADGEFAPLKVLIKSLPGGPMVNLASPNEHVPEIE
jgi:hypothetical protein